MRESVVTQSEGEGCSESVVTQSKSEIVVKQCDSHSVITVQCRLTCGGCEQCAPRDR